MSCHTPSCDQHSSGHLSLALFPGEKEGILLEGAVLGADVSCADVLCADVSCLSQVSWSSASTSDVGCAAGAKPSLRHCSVLSEGFFGIPAQAGPGLSWWHWCQITHSRFLQHCAHARLVSVESWT